jgi:hypothetical protein
MATRKGKLTVKKTAKMTEKGRYGSGKGLYLQIVTGKNGNKPIRSSISVGCISDRVRSSPKSRSWVKVEVRAFGPTGDIRNERGRQLRRPYYFGKSLSLTYRDVGVSRMPRGLRHIALSISFLSPIVRGPDVFLATKIASLMFLPERRFLPMTYFESDSQDEDFGGNFTAGAHASSEQNSPATSRRFALSSLRAKDISLFPSPKSGLRRRCPVPTRGAHRDRHGRWKRDAMDVAASGTDTPDEWRDRVR